MLVQHLLMEAIILAGYLQTLRLGFGTLALTLLTGGITQAGYLPHLRFQNLLLN